MARIRYRYLLEGREVSEEFFLERYRLFPNAVIESRDTQKHPYNGAQYKVRIDLKNKRWEVLDHFSGLLVSYGHAVSLQRLKIYARQALDVLGVNKPRESRKRTPKTDENQS